MAGDNNENQDVKRIFQSSKLRFHRTTGGSRMQKLLLPNSNREEFAPKIKFSNSFISDFRTTE
jgi:hypothetical protein